MVSTDDWWNFCFFPHGSTSVVVIGRFEQVIVFHNSCVDVTRQRQTAWDWVSIVDAQVGLYRELEGGGGSLERCAAGQKV